MENNMTVNMRKLTAIVWKEEDTYVAKCPEIGTASQGKTVKEAIDNLKESTELYLEEFPEKEDRQAVITTFEVSEVARA
jgi:predicted RNase H-like HicB family nuclease